MPLEFRTGDLFAQGLPALAHGVNCRGGLGGLALTFGRRWPALAAAYSEACAHGHLQLGGMLVFTADDGTVVYNLATQVRGGPDARLDAIDASLRTAVAHAQQHGITAIGLPRIGAGIGGLAWSDVLDVIEPIAEATPVLLVVVTLPQQSGPAYRADERASRITHPAEEAP
jgi:O-acetyl-ADP-ribose deacetylase (regulator of RNase III)